MPPECELVDGAEPLPGGHLVPEVQRDVAVVAAEVTPVGQGERHLKRAADARGVDAIPAGGGEAPGAAVRSSASSPSSKPLPSSTHRTTRRVEAQLRALCCFVSIHPGMFPVRSVESVCHEQTNSVRQVVVRRGIPVVPAEVETDTHMQPPAPDSFPPSD